MSLIERPPTERAPASLAGRPFVKMNGLGNDFVILDARSDRFSPDAETIRAIANRTRGIGCDQVIVLETDPRADVFMRILNADGGEVEACGNATRCVADLVMAERGEDRITIRTAADQLEARRATGGIAVDMGRPLLGWADIPLSLDVADTRAVPIDVAAIDPALPSTFSAVSMGNPHAVFFVEDPTRYDLERIGPLLENHPLFPKRANISLVEIVSPRHLRQRVWERGAGLTLACGTGACAAAVAAIRAGLAESSVTVTLPGGDLSIDWQPNGHVIMTGAVMRDFDGKLPELSA